MIFDLLGTVREEREIHDCFGMSKVSHSLGLPYQDEEEHDEDNKNN